MSEINFFSEIPSIFFESAECVNTPLGVASSALKVDVTAAEMWTASVIGQKCITFQVLCNIWTAAMLKVSVPCFRIGMTPVTPWLTHTCGELRADTSSWQHRPCWPAGRHSSADGRSMKSSWAGLCCGGRRSCILNRSVCVWYDHFKTVIFSPQYLSQIKMNRLTRLKFTQF